MDLVINVQKEASDVDSSTDDVQTKDTSDEFLKTSNKTRFLKLFLAYGSENTRERNKNCEKNLVLKLHIKKF